MGKWQQSELSKPLLSRQDSFESPLRLRSYTEGTSASSTGPPRFKALRPRKTLEIAARARADSSTVDARLEDPSVDGVDPRLADNGASEVILSKIARLIYEHVEEGADFLAEDPADDPFHEAHFLRGRCRCCPWRRRRPEKPAVRDIFDLLSDVSRALFFCHQVVVISAVYIERLLRETTVILSSGNWRSIVLVALQTASKVSEDVHPWNADFEECLLDVAGLRYKAGALYRLESIFLNHLKWRVFVDGEEYGAFYFSLLEDRLKDISGDVLSPLETRSSRNPYDNSIGSRINPIYEEGALQEDSASERSDLERGGGPLSRASSRGSLSLISSSGEKGELLRSWRRMMNETGSSSAQVTRAMLDAWRLEKNNPHIGALRHAPRALAPSRHIPESADLLWAHELAMQTLQAMSPATSATRASAVSTLSGATGQRLASELQKRLDEYGGAGELGRSQGSKGAL